MPHAPRLHQNANETTIWLTTGANLAAPRSTGGSLSGDERGRRPLTTTLPSPSFRFVIDVDPKRVARYL
ncbi:MAG: hypothetical protein AAF662_11435 [Pseudomonadota bacterium]